MEATKEDLDKMLSILGDPEELTKELQDCLLPGPLGLMIKHKFVNELFYAPEMNGRYNKQLAMKREMVRVAKKGGDWHSYVFLHERPWRFNALMDLAPESMDRRKWWRLVAATWVDSENIRENARDWNWLLRHGGAELWMMMDEDDLKAFNELGPLGTMVQVWQGCTVDRPEDGWSWTTNRNTALWFAKRFANLEDSEPMVRGLYISKTDIGAMLTTRGEDEVLIDPDIILPTHVREETFGRNFDFPARPG